MKRALILAAAVALSSCSLQVDSQYGLRLGPPAVRSHEAPHVANPERQALPAESSTSPRAQATEASELWSTGETPTPVGLEAPVGQDAGVEIEAVDRQPFVSEQDLERSQPAIDQDVAADQQPAPSQNSIPYWLEVVLGTLGILVGFGLVVLGGIGVFLSVFAMGWGEVGPGIIGLVISLAMIVGGWLLIRYLQNNVLSFNMGDMFYGGGRLLNVVLGIAVLVLLLLLS